MSINTNHFSINTAVIPHPYTRSPGIKQKQEELEKYLPPLPRPLQKLIIGMAYGRKAKVINTQDLTSSADGQAASNEPDMTVLEMHDSIKRLGFFTRFLITGNDRTLLEDREVLIENFLDRVDSALPIRRLSELDGGYSLRLWYKIRKDKRLNFENKLEAIASLPMPFIHYLPSELTEIILRYSDKTMVLKTLITDFVFKETEKTAALRVLQTAFNLGLNPSAYFTSKGKRVQALHTDLSYGYAKFMIDNKADIEALDSDRRTPLHIAVTGVENIARLLLDAGANVNAKDIKGETPIFKAINYQNWFVVGELIQKGANLVIINSEGVSLFQHLQNNYIFRDSNTNLEIAKAIEIFEIIRKADKAAKDARRNKCLLTLLSIMVVVHVVFKILDKHEIKRFMPF